MKLRELCRAGLAVALLATGVAAQEGAPKGVTLRGRVHRGEQIPEAANVYVSPRFGPRQPGLGLHARTGDRGEFEIAGVPPGEALLSVEKRAWMEMEGEPASHRWIEIPDAPEHFVDVDLPTGVLEGRVSRASDGSAVEGVVVKLAALQTRGNRAVTDALATSGADGRYRIYGLPTGSFAAFVRAPSASGAEGLASEFREPVEVSEGNSTVLDFALVPEGKAAVSVFDSEGKPAPGVSAGIFPIGASHPLARGFLGESDESGVARGKGIHPGRCFAWAGTPETGFGFSEEGSVVGGEEATFRVDLRKGTDVRVRATDEQDRPVRVTFPSRLPAFTDSRGRPVLAIPGRGPGGEVLPDEVAWVLPAGEYTLRVRAFGYREASLPVRVGEKSPQEIVVRLERATADERGR
jgi:hypothetical protein